MKGHINETNGTLNDWQNSVTKMWKKRKKRQGTKDKRGSNKNNPPINQSGGRF